MKHRPTWDQICVFTGVVLTVIFALVVLALSGCAVAKSRVTVLEKINGDTITTTESYAKPPWKPLSGSSAQTTTTNAAASISGAINDTNAKIALKAFRPYHFAALGCLLVAGSIIWLKWTRTIYALYFVGAGAGLSAWAAYVPRHEGQVFWGLVSLAVAGAVYVIWVKPRGGALFG